MSVSVKSSSLPETPALVIQPDRLATGRSAALHVTDLLERILKEQGAARVIFACAPSQNEFLDALIEVSTERVDWSKVTGFHMDEYVGMTPEHSASFRRYLQDHFLSQVRLGEFYPLQGDVPDLQKECGRYTALLQASPIDLICLGIGENGHLAFNDPPVADFADPETVKVVELDHACRMQQVHDGCFSQLDAVPKHALTLTLPVFQSARYLSVVVLGARKAKAVEAALKGEITTQCPASILRACRAVTLFLDSAASRLVV